MDKAEKEYYFNCILNNNRILCRDVVTQNEKLSDLIATHNSMYKNVQWLLSVVKSQQERINQLEARLFVKDHTLR